MPLLRNLVSTVAKNTSRDLWSDISGVLWSGLLDMAVRISVSSSWYLSPWESSADVLYNMSHDVLVGHMAYKSHGQSTRLLHCSV